MRYLVVSFDMGGVIDADPEGFRQISKRLREAGCKVIITSAFAFDQKYKGIVRFGDVDHDRTVFIAGRLHGFGWKPQTHYDALYTVDDYGTNAATGRLKDASLKSAGATLHIDDHARICEGITCCPTLVFKRGDSLQKLERQIFDVLKAKALVDMETKGH